MQPWAISALLKSHVVSYLTAPKRSTGTALQLGRLNAVGERWGIIKMRDIRGDLQDRANLIAEQISTTQGQFDKHIEQLKSLPNHS